MGRFVGITCAALVVIASGRAEASPLKLTIADGRLGPNLKADWSFDAAVGGPPSMRIKHRDSLGIPQGDWRGEVHDRIDGPISYTATLSTGDGKELAELTISGSFVGETRLYMTSGPNPMVVGEMNGEGGALASSLRLADGVSDALVPDWFRRLGATVKVRPDGVSPEMSQVVWTVEFAPTPVPEPGSVVVFLAAAGAGLAAASRRRRRNPS